jgi:hypothetical protein
MNRLDRLKEQHPDLNVSLIDIISFLDPTDSYKYTEFLIKNFKNDSQYYSTDKYEFMGLMGVFLFGSGEIETLNEFERHSKANRIKNKDISQYTNFLELNNEIKVATEIENRKKLEKEILKIYEDDTWFILTPLSLEASQVYGANTKWCVTQEKYWKQYLITHRLIYVLNKKTETKIAFSRDFNKNKFQAWDELDKEVDPMFVNFIPDELFLKIRKELQEDKTTGDLIGWGDNTSTIRRISDYPGVMTYDNTDGIISINGTNGEITTINNDSRSFTPSDNMVVVERIRRLMRTQPRQQLQPISDEPFNFQTISNNLGLNYVFEYNDRPYLDDLP